MAAFVKGQSGNPSGRPAYRLPDGRTIGETAREASPHAIATLVEVCGDKDAPTAARVSAATAILDRGFGKPTQPISGDEDFAPIVLELNTSALSEATLREIAAAT